MSLEEQLSLLSAQLDDEVALATTRAAHVRAVANAAACRRALREVSDTKVNSRV